MKNESKTKVIFRKFKNGEIIAIFPRELGTNSPYTCSSYVHVGQHGSCAPDDLICKTKLATPSEYADLARELRRIGYKLLICKRLRYADLEYRKKLLEKG